MEVKTIKVKWYYSWTALALITLAVGVTAAIMMTLILPDFSKSVYAPFIMGLIGFAFGFFWMKGRNKHVDKLKKEVANEQKGNTQ